MLGALDGIVILVENKLNSLADLDFEPSIEFISSRATDLFNLVATKTIKEARNKRVQSNMLSRV